MAVFMFLVWTLAAILIYLVIGMGRFVVEALTINRLGLRFSSADCVFIQGVLSIAVFEWLEMPPAASGVMFVVVLIAGIAMIAELAQIFERWLARHDHTAYFRSIQPKKLYSE